MNKILHSLIQYGEMQNEELIIKQLLLILKIIIKIYVIGLSTTDAMHLGIDTCD